MRERLRGGGLQAPGKSFLFCPANVHPKVSIYLHREIKMEEGASTLKTRTNRALALKASSDCIHQAVIVFTLNPYLSTIINTFHFTLML